MGDRILQHSFYQQNVIDVAKQLLGKRLVSKKNGELASGLIVETEAYLHERDSACHAFRGRTPGNSQMFEQAGTAYVYPIHAKYCFNVVAQNVNQGCAVLIRAIQPLEGIESMAARRRVDDVLNLARGPARLCQALGIDRADNGAVLTSRDSIWIDHNKILPVEKSSIKATRRIGVTSAKQRLLRFVIAGNDFVSGPKYLR